MRSGPTGAITAGGLGIAALAVGAWAQEPTPPVLQPDDPAIVAQGAQLYADTCAACHGADLEGQPDWRARGPDGRMPAPPHDATGHTWHHDGDTLFRLTKYGVGEMIGDPDYVSDMPAYEGILTDGEIAAILSYIKSTWPADIRDRHDAMAE